MSENFELDKGYPVELPVWQAPNDFVRMEFERDETRILFKTWKKNRDYSKSIGILTFKNTWGIRTIRHKNLSYYPNEEDHNFRSYYLEIKKSSWLDQLIKERSKDSSDWKINDRSIYGHFIIQSHSFFIEIISERPEFSRTHSINWS